MLFVVWIKRPVKQRFARMMRRCSFAWITKSPAASLLQCRPPQRERCQTFASYPTSPDLFPHSSTKLKKITLRADRRLMLGTFVAWQEFVSALCFEIAFLQRDFIADTTSEWHARSFRWHHWRTWAHCKRDATFDLSVWRNSRMESLLMSA